MPKLIDYPRTAYAGAWELSEIVDDTGGKCALEMAARKLDRKVSGSFKAIIGSAVKFGLMTSKREVLSTTTLFRRIKHAYDKQEELLFHREAFLTPPLFTQLCRKFRGRELPVQMLDVMLIREFAVEEINAQGVAKAFVDGARMVGLLDEHDTMADIDTLAGQQPPRRELASPPPPFNTFRAASSALPDEHSTMLTSGQQTQMGNLLAATAAVPVATPRPTAAAMPLSVPPNATPNDAIANLFGLSRTSATNDPTEPRPQQRQPNAPLSAAGLPASVSNVAASSSRLAHDTGQQMAPSAPKSHYQVQISGPGVDTTLSITDEDDIMLVKAMLEKIRRQLSS